MPDNKEIGRSVEFPCFESEFDQQDVVPVEFGDISHSSSHRNILNNNSCCTDNNNDFYLKEVGEIERIKNTHKLKSSSDILQSPNSSVALNDTGAIHQFDDVNNDSMQSAGLEKDDSSMHYNSTVSNIPAHNNVPTGMYDNNYFFHVPHYIPPNDGSMGFNKEYSCLTVTVDGKYYYTPYYFTPAHYIGPLLTDKGIIQGCFYNYNGAEAYRYLMPHDGPAVDECSPVNVCRDIKTNESLNEDSNRVLNRAGIKSVAKVDCSVQTDDCNLDYNDSFQYADTNPVHDAMPENFSCSAYAATPVKDGDVFSPCVVSDECCFHDSEHSCTVNEDEHECLENNALLDPDEPLAKCREDNFDENAELISLENDLNMCECTCDEFISRNVNGDSHPCSPETNAFEGSDEISEPNEVHENDSEVQSSDMQLQSVTCNSDSQSDSSSPLMNGTVVDAVPSVKSDEPAAKKSWASLFKDNQQEFLTLKFNSLQISKPEPRKKPEKPKFSNNHEQKFTTKMNGFYPRKENSSSSKSVSEILRKHVLKSSAPALTPRGLFNDGNWCYMNATLQALLACPHFYNFIETIPMPKVDAAGNIVETTTPFLSHISHLFKQFSPMYRSGNGKASRTDIQIGEPLKIPNLHSLAASLQSGRFMGKQEDAHEFLTKLLAELHNETYMCMNNTTVPEGDQGNQDDANWQEMFKRKAQWFREIPTEKTPISDIFCGCFRLTVEKSGSKASSVLEPFYSISLNPAENSNMIKALKCLKERVPVSGFIDPATRRPVKAFHTTLIEKLPPCLIIHSKCFVVGKNSTVQKIIKRFSLLVDLVVPEDVLSRNSNLPKGKKYKLFAVIHHRGRNIECGHYISDVFHPGLPGWIRCDDNKIFVVPSKEVLNSSVAELTPYLLLYREY